MGFDVTPLTSRFEAALQLAVGLHQREARQGRNVPLVAHLLGACAIALEHDAAEDEAVAVLLHHVPDCLGQEEGLNLLRRRFGEQVAQIVDECGSGAGDADLPWNEQKEAFIATIPEISEAARFVSLAEKLDDAQSIFRDYQEHGESVWERYKGGREGVLWYYRELARAFDDAEPLSMTSSLAAVVDELANLAGEE